MKLLDDETLDLMAEHRTFYDPNIGLVLQNYLDNRAKFEGVWNYDEAGFAYMAGAIPTAAVFAEPLAAEDPDRARPRLGIIITANTTDRAVTPTWPTRITQRSASASRLIAWGSAVFYSVLVRPRRLRLARAVQSTLSGTNRTPETR